MDPVIAIHSFLLGQSLVKTFLRFLKGLLLKQRQKYTPWGLPRVQIRAEMIIQITRLTRLLKSFDKNYLSGTFV